MEPLLEVHDVWKSFHTFTRVGVKEFLLKGRTRNHSHYSREWALGAINFNVKRGKALGVVGHNGAGKSTLLGLLLGTMLPDRGHVQVRGKIAGLLDLGAGFHPELSGRENVFLYGSILGMRLADIRRKLSQIVEFSELQDAVDEPIRTYSAGMIARLGFSTIIHAESDVLLVDEVLAVGDAGFQRKCFDFIVNYRQSNRSLVIASHDLGSVEAICDEAICLEKGRIYSSGEVKKVLHEYRDLANVLS